MILRTFVRIIKLRGDNDGYGNSERASANREECCFFNESARSGLFRARKLFITLKDAIKREWVVRLKYFQEADVSSLRLAPFEYPSAFLGLGEIETQDLVPLEIDMLTEEVILKDIVGYEYVIEFRDIIDVELL